MRNRLPILFHRIAVHDGGKSEVVEIVKNYPDIPKKIKTVSHVICNLAHFKTEKNGQHEI